MAQHNFKGNIENVTERQLHLIADVIKDLGFDNSQVTFEPVGIAGDNYAANVKRIILEREHGSLTMIAKIAPTIPMFRYVMNTLMLFQNEHIMYTDVLPKFTMLLNEAGVEKEDQLRYAKCYGSCTEELHEVILLEDLKPLNYVMLDRFKSLSNECIKSILKNFAIYHSLSYALKQKEPETFTHYKAELKNMWASQGGLEHMKIYFQSLEDEVLLMLEDHDHIKAVKGKVTCALDMSAKLAIVENDNKSAVIVQGDSWTNNIMFKFEDDKLKDSILIDYQLSHVNSPVNDLMYMIFNCTDHETRSKYFYDWLDYYHSELDKALSNFNLKANFLFPRDKLDADLKRHGKVMLGFSIALASMLIRKSDDAAKMMEAMKTIDLTAPPEEFAVTQLDEESRILFKNRVTGLIQSFLDFGLI